ncbi:MAG: 3-hydroxyacyl-CoA dehydrogenase family protein [Burkholderiaceae bacterium]|nr:3-hydroxyacyl-CoA dehydrogenase family protein [Burkholderiaceae bacterium]
MTAPTHSHGIRRAAVIGAGPMGAGIAAQFANGGVPVDLLDVAGPDTDRDAPALAGLARVQAANAFATPEAAALVRVGNVDDHMNRLAEADWIVEAVVERLEVKRALFARIEAARKPGSLVSSNTSTLLRADLVAAMSATFAKDFVIMHYFNPPWIMRLVELVGGPQTPPGMLARASAANRDLLGKVPVICRDTPGFNANRIGCFWMAMAAREAMRLGLGAQQADAVHAAFGIPRTGVFGLFDLIGIDLVPHVWGSLLRSLPADDDFQRFDITTEPLFRSLVATGRHGRKTGGGFYRKGSSGAREVLDLVSGDYTAELPAPVLPGGGNLAALVADPGVLGHFARAVLIHVIAYAATHAPDIADDVSGVDTAVELGYSWREGPFRLADRLGVGTIAAALRAEGRVVPSLLSAAVGLGGFYRDGVALRGDGSGYARPLPEVAPIWQPTSGLA